MSYRPEFRNILHPSIEVDWCGFQSSLGDLARTGWEFEILSHEMHHSVAVGMKHHRARVSGVSDWVDERKLFGLSEFMSRPDLHLYHDAPPDTPPRARYFMGWHVHLSFRLAEQHYIRGPMVSAMAVRDAQVGEVINEQLFVYELGSQAEQKPEEIIVMPDDVGVLLNRIQELQKPRAKELLEKKRKADDLKDISMKAKILTFGDAS